MFNPHKLFLTTLNQVFTARTQHTGIYYVSRKRFANHEVKLFSVSKFDIPFF